jgi:hypothetical protein
MTADFSRVINSGKCRCGSLYRCEQVRRRIYVCQPTDWASAGRAAADKALRNIRKLKARKLNGEKRNVSADPGSDSFGRRASNGANRALLLKDLSTVSSSHHVSCSAV